MKIIFLAPKVRNTAHDNIDAATQAKVVYCLHNPLISYLTTADILSCGNGYFDLKIYCDLSKQNCISYEDIDFESEFEIELKNFDNNEYIVRLPIEYIWCIN